jgi:8-oxo-dGTP diphosphatase
MAKKAGTLIVVAAALVDAEGRVLLQRRPEGRAMAGLWEFPGGKMEEGERPESALARELEEELGIAVDEPTFEPAAFASADNRGRNMLLLLYLCRTWRGEPAPLHASALAWVAPADMASLPMPPADVPLVERLIGLLAPPRNGEGDHAKHGGGGPTSRRS